MIILCNWTHVYFFICTNQDNLNIVAATIHIYNLYQLAETLVLNFTLKAMVTIFYLQTSYQLDLFNANQFTTQDRLYKTN